MLTKVKERKKTLAPVLLIAMLIVLAIFALFGGSLKAQAYNLWGYDLVDSGKHMDWKGSSKYISDFEKGVNTWNSYKSGVIRKDGFWTINDCTISDYSENSSTGAVTYSSGKIQFNTTVMDTLTTNQKHNVAIHELGHALGLDHNNDPTSVVYTYVTSVTTLSADDKAGYDYLYNNVY